MNDEFYIGYLDRTPPGLARRLRVIVATLLLVFAGVATLIASRQTPVEPGSFEYGVQRTFEGVLRERPLPTLRQVGADGSVSNSLLVGFGKHGLPGFARGHDGHRVRFGGSLIRSGSMVMIELNAPETFQDLGPASEADVAAEKSGTVVVGDVTLIGELVDTKCYYGVMRPATGKVHRGCAARCLSGGVPPGLLLRDGDGGAVVVLLSGPEDGSLRINPEWAALTLRVEGRLSFREGQPHLEVHNVARLD